MNRRRERGSLWRLFRENIKTFLNVMFGMILDPVDTHVGRYAKGLRENNICLYSTCQMLNIFSLDLDKSQKSI